MPEQSNKTPETGSGAPHETPHTRARAEQTEKANEARHQEMIRKQGAFLQAFAKSGCIKKAAQECGIDRDNHYQWLDEDPDYAKLYSDIERRMVDEAEDALRDRALNGMEVVKTIAGAREIVREFDGEYLFFFLRAHRPDKYREHQDVTITNLGEITEALKAGRERAAKAKAELAGKQT